MKTLQLSQSDSRYPALLREISDPPDSLWVEGDGTCLQEGVCVAIVGARKCTTYGEKIAFDFASDLAREGVVVVSGLAYGIDTAAHRGALAGGGKTIAVLGSGIRQTYPAQNRELRRKITESGAVISEFEPDREATTWSFPRRNRLISGLSAGVVVVEAGLKSGSLITAYSALEQGREVFAVPGSLHSELSVGCHHLIQKGAKLVTCVKDIFEEIRFSTKQVFEKKHIKTSEEGESVLTLLAAGPKHMDELMAASGYPVDKMSSVLIELEMDGRVVSLPGSNFVRSEC